MLLPRLLHALSHSLEDQAVFTLLEQNRYTQPHGLTLSPDDAHLLLAVREQALGHYDRVEIGVGAAAALIEVFAASVHMEADSFAGTLAELLELFYAIKSDTEDRIGDLVLIEAMKERFDGECGGAIELLRGSMEEYASRFRSGLTPGEESEDEEDAYER
ncbi:hypothetical protein B5M42_023430 [Paenibacillus athensensis]|uniref:Uncharacterized protein n=1 Tax=Paenibacillus athensensis TaxID=1967502 RepID=A0A4Y8PU49_9BACL|nr:DUF6323 family protein [Paenibacillus athensensis]MCD1261753.1 hypothetical protein [Paenibacillus athensensis]